MMSRRGFTTGSKTSMLLLAAFVVPMVLSAATDLPLAESFEDYPLGTDLQGTGYPWEDLASSNSIVVTAGDPGYPFGYVLNTGHTQVASISNSTLAEFTMNSYTNAKYIYIDVMMNPVPRDSAPDITDSNVSAAVYLGTNGMLNIYAKTKWDGAAQNLDPAVGQLGKWIELSNSSVPTGTWFRLSMQMSYRNSPVFLSTGNEVFYRVAANGTYITATNAFDVDASDNGGPNPSGTGTWFCAANAGTIPDPLFGSGVWGLENAYISSIATEGPGLIDDLVVSSNAPSVTAGPTSIYGVPSSWYASMGLLGDPDGDFDGDGMLNYEEFWAGTDAKDINSVLEFVVIYGGGTNYVYWTGDDSTTNTPYELYTATNITAASPWTVLDSVPRVSPGSTNMYAHPAPPPSVMYQVRVPFTYTNP